MSMKKAIDGATKPKRAAPKAKVSSLTSSAELDYDAPSTPLRIRGDLGSASDLKCRAIMRTIVTDREKGPIVGKHR